jgi:elongation factor Ts
MFLARRSSFLVTQSRTFSTYKPDIEAIKKLRAASEAPLKDVKNALLATNGDFPAAFEWLRKKGIASATAKAGRTTAEGLIGVHIDGKSGAMVEINSETDFVAMNDKFQDLVSQVSKALVESEKVSGNIDNELQADALSAITFKENGKQVKIADKVPELVGKVGENVVVRRGIKFDIKSGSIASYLHNTAAPGLGRAGALVALEYDDSNVSAESAKAIQSLGHRLAMHVVAAKPAYLSRKTVPEEAVQKERNFLAEQVKDSGKPAHIVEKMTEGRLSKFFGEITLLEQPHFIEEGNPKVGAFLKKAGEELGINLKVVAYKRYEIGEDKDEASA